MRNGKHLLTVVLFFGVSTLVFGWENIVQIVTVSADTYNERPITIHAAGRGNPYVNFKDGVELSANTSNVGAGAAMAAADFDSDGVADVVVVGTDGSIQMYKGESMRLPTLETMSSKAVPRDPFRPAQISNSTLGISPDEVFAGDLNADGLQDILAYERGSGGFVFASGDGRGNFSPPMAIAVNGSITALTVNEIGRPDGQADVAVAYSGKDGSFVDVYEHPESAFKYAPERFKIPASATALTVGNLDEDFYADIAVASGNSLTIIHGRGQAYPWHLIPDLGIQRPAAIVATRQMRFAISAMTSGRFGERRGTSLAMLGSDGNVYQLEPTREKMRNDRFTSTLSKKMTRQLMLPSGTQPRNIGIVTEPTIPTPSEVGKQLVAASEITANGLSSFIENAVARDAEKYEKMTPAERERILADANVKKALYNERSKRGYLHSISAKPSKLANWTIETLTNDAPFVSAAASGSNSKLQTVNVSSSNLDDMLVIDDALLQILSRVKPEGEKRQAEVASFDVDGGVASVLPIRLNLDALSDFVVLRHGSSSPTVVMTEPFSTFTVNVLDDSASNCLQPGQNCTLREAIQLSNSGGGTNAIDFSVTGTLEVESELPVVHQPVSIYGIVDSNGNPLIEISGVNLDGQGRDGLKIRTSNSFISGLNINRFTAIYDPESGSSFGGNGLTIESTTLSPDNGNNVVISCYLGTDPTGSLDVGNGATGLNIFDSDDNEIGSTNPVFKNVISGNGSIQSIGAGISLTVGNTNRFFGNIIGLNSQGTGKLGNSQGMFFTGANNEFGGDAAGAGNTVSGNGEPYPLPSEQCSGRGMGIVMAIDIETGAFLTSNNNIRGNRMGTDPSGSFRMGNCWKALSTGPLTQTIVGSITQNGRNTISGNGLDGINCSEFVAILGEASEGGFCAISGNNIGTDITGNIAIPNDWTNQLPGFVVPTGAVEIENNYSFSNLGAPGGTTPNGPCTGFCNIVSGNNGGFWGAGAFGYGTVAVFNNHLGLNQVGNEAIPNEFPGIASASTIGNTYIGLGVFGQSLGNVITGNGGVNAITTTGSGIGGIFQTYYFQGNYVGTDSSGTFSSSPEPMGGNNGAMGVQATSLFGDTLYIGGANIEARNVISGHKGTSFGAGTGIQLYGSTGFIGLYNNLIGLNRSLQPLGNQANGIQLNGASETRNVQIGGTGATANQIAYNGTSGRNYAGILVNNLAQGIPLQQNIIHNNIGLGIDLNPNGTFWEGDGVTANDCFDGDIGANGVQNYPALLTYGTNDDGQPVVIGYLRSQPSEQYLLDFYQNPTPGDSNYGEGQNHIGSMQITTNGSGFRSFEFVIPSANLEYISATATDSFGNTSEFSCHVGACIDPVRPTSTEEVDELFAVSICADPIIVNTTTNDGDFDELDETCDTDADEPGSQCSLRAAIEEAESQPGANAIIFDIPGAGPHTITPQNTNPWPQLTQPVSIDATTQPDYDGVPQVIIDGIQTVDQYGFRVKGGNSSIRGLSIINFKEQIGVSGVNNVGFNKIGGNYIGIKPDGSPGILAKQQYGIVLLSNATENRIGGFLPSSRNIIGATQTAISVGDGSLRNKLVGNYIGVAADGSTSVPNINGIVLINSNENNIGSLITNAPNVISNSTEYGIRLINASRNRVSGNLIGTNSDGSAAAPNVVGVNIQTDSAFNFIGGTNSDERNVISGHALTNNSVGVAIRPDAGEQNIVAGNYIGVSKDGDAAIPNHIGIAVNADKQIIGNANEAEFKNLIVSTPLANSYGIYLHPFFPNDQLGDVTVQNNSIGTLTALSEPSGQIGIYLFGDVSHSTIKSNTVGNNYFAGIRLNEGPHNNTVSNNYVGVSPNGNLIPNLNGIAVRQSDTNFIKDNVVAGNSRHGIAIGDGFGQNDMTEQVAGGSSFAINNVVTGNKVGTDICGSIAIPNADVGIGVGLNARDTRIGGPGNEGNIVGGASNQGWPFGIFVGTINDAADVENIPHRTKVEGNRIGVGSAPNNGYLANGYGIYVRNAVGTLIGGTTKARGNIVANNLNDGIRLFKPLTSDTIIENNYIGVLPDLSIAGNAGNGLSLDSIGNSEINFNVIGGNGENGVFAVNIGEPALQRRFPSVTKLIGNQVGAALDQAGVPHNVGNGLHGLLFDNVSQAEIGKLVEDADTMVKNLFSGNSGSGVLIQNGESNTLVNNVIGTAGNGETEVKNLLDGVKLINTANSIIGGARMGNTISGNGGNGVSVQGGGGHGMFGNLIGVFKNDLNTFIGKANLGSGILLSDSPQNRIGSNAALMGNVVAANQQLGIQIDGILASFNKIQQNKIGVVTEPDPLSAAKNSFGVSFGNGSHGIWVTNGAGNNIVGGQEPNSGNVIARNGGSGVWIDPTAGQGNLVDPNSIYGNTGLGIDITYLGVTFNDAGDADEGGNRGQNFPEITDKQIVNDELIVTFRVDSLPTNSDYGNDGLYIEFFKADATGEGELFLGSTYYTVDDHNGSLAGLKSVNLGNIAILGVGTNDRITATATDAGGNTSEFFPVFGPTAAGVDVSGRALRSDGQGIPRALLTLTSDDGTIRRVQTNAFGRYRFDDVESGRTYVLAISHKQFEFETPTRVLVVADSINDADFTSLP